MTDVPAGKVPILESASVAYKYLAENWQRWMPACLILGVVSGWYQMQSLRSAIDMSNGVNSNLTTFGVFCVFILTSIIVGVGIYKHALRGEFSAPIGLGFGIDEMRVLGVTLSLALLFGIFGFFFALIFAVVASILVASNGLDAELASTNPELFVEQFIAAIGPNNGPIMLIFIILVALGLLFIAVRLTFVTAATVNEERMMVFQTWGFAKGNFWRIVAAILLTVLPPSILGGILVGIAMLLLGVGAGEEVTNAALPQIFVISSVSGFVNALVSVASIALMAYMYKGLRPSDEELAKLSQKAN